MTEQLEQREISDDDHDIARLVAKSVTLSAFSDVWSLRYPLIGRKTARELFETGAYMGALAAAAVTDEAIRQLREE